MKFILGALVSVVLLSNVASADLIGFSASFDGGTIYWDGKTADPLVGTGIGITTLTASGTATNSGTYAISGGALSFATGAFLGATTGPQGQTILDFGPGGSFDITGSVPAAGISQTALLTGNFTGTSTFDALLGIFGTTNGSGVNTLGGSLISFFGLPNTPMAFTATISSIQTPLFSVGPFIGVVTGVQVTDPSPNAANISPVPEPASIILLSLVLLACTTILRRHRRT